MNRDKWNVNFDWYQSGTTWILQNRNEQYDENRFISLNDIYFKNQEYLSGVSYTYINKLEDIYKRDLITGDGYSLYNTYNEYDVVDRVMKHIQFIDVAATSNIDITKQWRKINNIQLKAGQFILLNKQDSEFENDVYKVTQQYYLENAGYLSTRQKAERFSVSVKMGTYKDKQFFLINNGNEFPITGEPKYFVEGNSFILKHIIKYNLYNTSSNSAVTSKIIFTDYEIAKKQLPVNYELYDDISFVFVDTGVTSDYFQIHHHHDSYYIRSGVTDDRYVTGLTSQIYNNTDPISGGTTITGISPFIANVHDYVRIVINSGATTYMDFNSHVKLSGSDYVVLQNSIPNRLLNYTSGMEFRLYNQNIATSWANAISQMNNTPYSRFFDISNTLNVGVYDVTISPKEYKYDKYFDYNDLSFKVFDGGLTSSFSTLNNYLKYNLYTRLNLSNPSVFTSSFSFYSGFTTTSLSSSYIDNNRIKVTFSNSGDTSNFREYTYVYLNNNTDYKSLIWKIDGGDIYVEKPTDWSGTGTAVSQIDIIDGLYNISEILQEVFINVTYGWYIEHKDNIRRKICSAYGQLLSESEDFRLNVTGLLYENEFNEFILKLYDLDDDHQLSFTTIELMRLGADRKTRIPVPLDKESMVEINYSTDFKILDGGLIYIDIGTTSVYLNTASGTTEVFDFDLDVVLGGPNDPPLMFNIINGNG